MSVITKQISENHLVKVEFDDHSCDLYTTHNGYQWSGAAIYDLETAKAAHKVLEHYIREQEEGLVYEQ